MAAIISPRTPASGGDGAAFAGVPELYMAVQRANHATAFAGWVVATTSMGVVLEVGTVRNAGRSPLGVLLLVLLVPILAGVGHVLVLLVRAGRITDAALCDFYRFIEHTPADAPDFSPVAWREFQRLAVASGRREALSQRALRWAYGSGIAFLTWALIAVMAT